MSILYRNLALILLSLNFCSPLLAQRGYGLQNRIWFTQNKGQWHSNVLYQLKVPGGNLSVEQGRFLFHFVERKAAKNGHADLNTQDPIRHHAYAVNFVNANPEASIKTEHQAPFHENYFTDANPEKWAKQTPSYGTLTYQNLYPGIDLKLYGKHNTLKYDLKLSPYADPKSIQLEYKGTSRLELDEQGLLVHTTLGHVREKAPIAYQYVEGLYTAVPCHYVLEKNKLSFAFPEGYKEDLPLIIDPELDFSSLSGSTEDNWGYTATYDNEGNMYAAGVVFGTGYPTTTGAFQSAFSDGDLNLIDIGLTKFSADGSSLIYSTYLGGEMAETPMSLVVNDANELFVLANTASPNYPTSAGAYDETFNGGTVAEWIITSFGEGTDLAVSKFDATGGLLASTFVGGSGNDGVNYAPKLAYNYGDETRGEIVITPEGTCLVSSSTHSSDFPSSTNAAQGKQDGCVFEIDGNLSNLLWSTYVGGAEDDGAYAVQQDGQGNVFVAGGTSSSTLSFATGLSGTYQGNVDGFLAKLNRSGTTFLGGTYLGTSAYDQAYFVQLDRNDGVYTFGQTDGTYSVTPGVYSNPNSGQFIHKLDNTLGSTEFSSTFGTQSGKVDISPSAFMVDKCDKIYISGWGGESNYVQEDYGALSSTTSGLPTSDDAFQSETDGSDFYLAVFEADMADLEYGTFFGGPISKEHVDGGTSRFDKRGYIYQSVCAGCGGNSDFPTTADAWSQTNGTNFSCNLGAFKFSLSRIKPAASCIDPDVCLTDTVTFVNSSEGGNTYEWHFGDGNTSNAFSPSHVYADTGKYTVTLIVADSLGCILPDTSEVEVEILTQYFINVPPIDSICPGDTTSIELTGGFNYLWSPTDHLSSSTTASTLSWPPSTTTYQVVSQHECGNDTVQLEVPVHEFTPVVSPETTICIGDSVMLFAAGGATYLWSPAESVSEVTSPTPWAKPDQTTIYTVVITTANSCEANQEVIVHVQPDNLDPKLNEDATICSGGVVLGQASGADSYTWFPRNGVSDPNSAITILEPQETTTYYVEFKSPCRSEIHSFTVFVNTAFAQASPEQIHCPGDTVELWASGGITYAWSPADLLSDPASSSPFTQLEEEQAFQVIVTDSIGCKDTASTFVSLYDEPWVNAGVDQQAIWGSPTQLEAITSSEGTLFWLSQDTLMSCTDCIDPVISPLESLAYIAQFTDENGCRAKDTVWVNVEGALYVPNAFTPDGDGTNDVFKAEGKEIIQYELWIFDRWGELIFTSKDIDTGWDGTVNGRPVQIDTYVWKIKFEDILGRSEALIGHVNVIR